MNTRNKPVKHGIGVTENEIEVTAPAKSGKDLSLFTYGYAGGSG